jgi:hypothetical protein
MPVRAGARRALRFTTVSAVVFLLAAAIVAVAAVPAFAAAPTVTKLTLGTQSSGASQQLGGLLVDGGQTVTIAGSGFTGATHVHWGSTDMTTGFTVNSASSITLTTPPEPAGTVVHVSVTTASGTSADNPMKNVAGYIGCTFNGNAPDGLITGVVAGTTQVAIHCINTAPSQSFVITVASPLAGFVTPASIGNQESLIMGAPVSFSADATGTLNQNYTIPATQVGSDPDAKCPPSQDQANVGLINCALAVADFGGNNYGDDLVAYATGQLTPQTSNLVVTPTSGNHGDSVTVTPCNFSVNPHTGSCGWWGQTAVTPIPAANVSIGGSAATTASLSVSAPVYTEAAGSKSGTLTGGSLSGTFNVPSAAPGGAQTLAINEPNGSFVPGNGPGNTVQGTTSFTVNGVTPTPTVTSVSPTSGPTAGGNNVAITGTGFTTNVIVTSVDFGGVTSPSWSHQQGTDTVNAAAPAHAAGTVHVHITTAGGTSADNGTLDQYTYVAAPTVTAVSPTNGPAAGGTTVTITGTNLSNATGVDFGGTAATGLTNNTATSIQVTSPAHAAGTVDVHVTTAGGTSATNSPADNYTYNAATPAPTVTSVNPTAGPTTAGTLVTITGTNLSGALGVDFGGTAATNLSGNTATSITVNAPAHAAGTVDVHVTTAGGTSGTNAPADQYTFVAAPTVTGVSPSSGSNAGGTSVTITGTNLSNAINVSFGGTLATNLHNNTATSITVNAPSEAPGTVDVMVTTPGGTSAVNSPADNFTYIAQPAVTGVSPSSGPNAGGTIVTITGTDLSGATAVDFGGVAATGLTNNTASSIQVTAPAGSGTVDVHVTTAGGTSATNSPADNFTYVAPGNMTCMIGAGVPTKPGKPNKNIGTVKFSPGQTGTASTKSETVKLSGTLEGCTNVPNIASKYPITAGAFTATITLPTGASCSNFVPGAPIKTKLTIKWEGINPKTGKLATAAPTDNTTVTTFVQDSGPFGFSLTTPLLAGSKSLFMGKSVSMSMVIDQTASEIATSCATKGGLKALNFTGVSGISTITLS